MKVGYVVATVRTTMCRGSLSAVSKDCATALSAEFWNKVHNIQNNWYYSIYKTVIDEVWLNIM